MTTTSVRAGLVIETVAHLRIRCRRLLNAQTALREAEWRAACAAQSFRSRRMNHARVPFKEARDVVDAEADLHRVTVSDPGGLLSLCETITEMLGLAAGEGEGK